MRLVTMTIDLDGRHIPELVCTGYPAVGGDGEHVAAVAKAIAESLGIEDYLGKPDRIHELRRTMWARTRVPTVASTSMAIENEVMMGARG